MHVRGHDHTIFYGMTPVRVLHICTCRVEWNFVRTCGAGLRRLLVIFELLRLKHPGYCPEPVCIGPVFMSVCASAQFSSRLYLCSPFVDFLLCVFYVALTVMDMVVVQVRAKTMCVCIVVHHLSLLCQSVHVRVCGDATTLALSVDGDLYTHSPCPFADCSQFR